MADEVAHHPGVVWLPIISLRREDAARLGYDNAQNWKELLTRSAPEIAKAMAPSPLMCGHLKMTRGVDSTGCPRPVHR